MEGRSECWEERASWYLRKWKGNKNMVGKDVYMLDE